MLHLAAGMCRQARWRPQLIYRAIVERHFGKTYWTYTFGKSMSSQT